MNVHNSTHRNVIGVFLTGVLLAALSFNADAESTATLATAPPVAATLLPSVKVTASISNPSAGVRWSVASNRPLRVTLMPTLTITADFAAYAVTTLPTATAVAKTESSSVEQVQALALAPTVDAPTLGVGN